MWGITLEPNSAVSLARQIFLGFQERIITGQLQAGEPLPSTRALCKELGVSRNTVCEAYDMLLTEGFLISRQGAPTRVAQGLTIRRVEQKNLPAQATPDHPPVAWDFRTGQPDLSLFPWQQWSHALRSAADTLSVQELGYRSPKGYAPLCAELADWLLRRRGMAVDPADVFITAGATQALHLLVDLLRRDGRAFAIETPSHPGIHTMLLDKGYPIHPMPVDGQGADSSSLEGTTISAAYVTPSHQFPLGGILPASRRAELLRLAKEGGFLIMEDDYDSEFRYAGAPVSPIYCMDPSHVAYVGTFSKTLFPALRLGFVVLPKAFHNQFLHLRTYLDVQSPILEQAALAEFLRTRKMDRHVQHMRRAYGERRDVLLRSIERAFGPSARCWGDASGLHVALQVAGMEFGEAFITASRNAGIRVNPLWKYCGLEYGHRDKLLLGYAHLTPDQIEPGVAALRRVIEECAT